MMGKQHNYNTTINWTGNRGTGTSGYRAYDRSHVLMISGKPDILCSSDPAFQGDNKKYNPEDLFLASISSCHMLWYLHLCADAGIIVVGYTDNATGVLEEDAVKGGRFVSVILNPIVTVTQASMIDKAIELHHPANKKCFIANSVNFQIQHNARCLVVE